MKELEKEQFGDRYKKKDARQPNASCSMSWPSIAERESEVTVYHFAVIRKFGYDECTPKSQGHLVVKRSA